MGLRVLDLFSGIGGFSLGLERAGMRTVAFCEIEPFCRAVLRKHWPDIPIFRDIRTLAVHEGWLVSNANERCQSSQEQLQPGRERIRADSIDVICGGFPCQDISVAGKGAGIEGERSGLWSEYARIIGEVRPRYVIVENVAALLGRGLDRVLGDLAALRFDAEWHCIPASAVGAPHRRDRLWIVANPDSSRQRERWRPEPIQPEISGAEYGSENVAHADSGNQQRGRGALQMGRLGIEREIARHGETQWAIEPDVGFRANGISTGLDGDRINADAEEKRSGECLQTLRKDAYPQADQRQIGGSQRIFAPSLLQQIMHGGGVCQRHAIEIGAAQTGDEIPWQALRILWGYDETARPSYRREQAERLTAEYPDLMRELSRFAPPPCAACWQDNSWENGLSRVAKGVPKRVDRLRSLGNAVVPQIPEIIGRAIMEAAK